MKYSHEILNVNEYTCFSSNTSTLYLKGKTNLTQHQILSSLENNIFPENLRGNFSLIWLDKFQNYCFAVDHFSSFPLFYTENKVSQYFYDISRAEEKLTENSFFKKMRSLLMGMTVGQSTAYKEISRVEPGHYVMNGKSKRFINLLRTEQTNEYDPYEIKMLLLDQIKDNDTLLLSSGKDSGFLLNLIQGEKKCNFLNITSPFQIYTERFGVERIQKFYSIDIEYIVSEYTGAILSQEENKKFLDFWIENPFLAKYDAIRKSKFKNGNFITGEIGLGIYSANNLLTYAIQKPNLTIRDFCKFLIFDIKTNGKYKSDLDIELDLETKIALEFLIDYFETQFKKSSLDITSTLIHLASTEISTFRLFSYSQDKDHKWIHPYADWNFVNKITSLPATLKVNNKYEKYLYIDILKDKICLIPWEYPKNGLSIPEINKF
jgi:hypothetical protein